VLYNRPEHVQQLKPTLKVTFLYFGKNGKNARTVLATTQWREICARRTQPYSLPCIGVCSCGHWGTCRLSISNNLSFFWPTVVSVVPLVHCVVCRLSVVCNVLYCDKTVRPSEKLSEGVNRKPWSKSWFLGLPPYFYFQFRCYGHWDGRFCLIFCPYSPAIGTRWYKWTF